MIDQRWVKRRYTAHTHAHIHTHTHTHTHADLVAVGFDDMTTAVASIEIAATIVVLIVAVTIADVVRMPALLLTGMFAVIWVFRILALAFFAVGCFDSSTFD